MLRPASLATARASAAAIARSGFGTGNQLPVSPGTLTINATAGTARIITAAELLAGVTDADGDTLSITALVLASGSAALTGSGPWQFVGEAEGAATLTATISDGRGGQTTRLVAVTVAPDESVVIPELYSRASDYQGMYRARAGSVTSYIRLPTISYTPNTDTMVWEFGALIYSDEAYTGTTQDTRISRGASATRDAIIKTLSGAVQLRTNNNITVQIAPDGTWPLGEFARFRLTDHPTSGFILEKMDPAGDYQHIQTTPRGTATAYLPIDLMGNATTGVHGTLLYWACSKNGTPLHDFRMDEMMGSTFYSAHDAAVTATYIDGGGKLVWKDETPESLAPQPDITVTGTLAHGATLTLTSSTLTFPGGVPQAYIYDDMTGRSGQVGSAATLGAFTSVKNADPLQTYKSGGPGGRPYVVRYDGPSGERLVRLWEPGFQFGEVFASRQIRIPDYWPGSTDSAAPYTPVARYIPDDSTWKDVWVLSSDNGGVGSGSDIILGSHTSADIWKHAGNSTTLGGVNAPGAFNMSAAWAWNEWTHMENYVRFNPADPQNGNHVMHLVNSRVKRLQAQSQGAVLCADRGYPLLAVALDGAWIDTNPMARIEAAEVYLAAGANAPCRVVITTSPMWLKGGKSALCPLLAHAPGEVSIRVGLGTMDPSTETLYAYYIGPDGLPFYPYGLRLNG